MRPLVALQNLCIRGVITLDQILKDSPLSCILTRDRGKGILNMRTDRLWEPRQSF